MLFANHTSDTSFMLRFRRHSRRDFDNSSVPFWKYPPTFRAYPISSGCYLLNEGGAHTSTKTLVQCAALCDATSGCVSIEAQVGKRHKRAPSAPTPLCGFILPRARTKITVWVGP